MHIELVDVLRCPVAHEDSWLVAAIARLDEREIVEGTLGCPVCGAEYPVRDRVVRFDTRAVTLEHAPSGEPDSDAVMRLGALLDLASPGGVVVLVGAWATHARALHDLTQVRVLLVDPPEGADVGWGVNAIVAPPGTVPLAGGSARAAAIDRAHAPVADQLVRALAAGGRLVAPVEVPVPAEVRELARDEFLWVGERVAAPKLVSLKRS